MTALEGLRVVELARDIAGPYCTKLLVDLGAHVTKIEPARGDPLRYWGPFPGGVSHPNRSGLFEYLNAGKHGATVDFDEDISAVARLISQAHVLVDGLRPGTLDGVGLGVEELRAVRQDLLIVRISDFGQRGPMTGRAATPLTVQATSGWVNKRDPDRPPVQAGARISEYVAGGYGALATLTALRTTPSQGITEVDVSVLEALLGTLPYPMLMAEKMRGLGLPANTRSAPMMGIVRAGDGWLGINCLTGQHWLDACAMLGLPEFGGQQIEIMLGGPQRGEFFDKAQPWLSGQSVADIVELSQAMRIPASAVNDGATVLDCPQYDDRGFFIDAGGGDWSFRRPGAPFRLSRTPVLAPGPAPVLGAVADVDTAPGKRWSSGVLQEPSSPFADIKVLDLTTFWAGAYVTCYLGAFGAEIIKVESIQRPDAHRYSGAWAHEGDRWYERSAMWQATNLNKSDITLDLTTDEGIDLVRRLIGQADVVIENFSPRVVENFDLDYPSLTALNADVIMMRMPGFGLHGPWRDYVGWALNFEQTSGMAAATGYAEGPPCTLQGPADPIVGVHAGTALLAALEHRRRTGEGQLIEVAQIEVAACITAEPVVEYSMNAVVQQRNGNRQRGYAQGVYPTAGEDDWVALSVRDDSDWAELVDAIGRPELLTDARFVSASERERAHDDFDAVVADWTRTHTAEQIIDALSARNIPVERVMTADRMYDIPQLDARGYYDEFEHPLTGRHRYPGWPFTMTPGPQRHHRFPPPTLGQHNDEVLRRLGLSDDEIADLRARRIIGEAVLNA